MCECVYAKRETPFHRDHSQRGIGRWTVVDLFIVVRLVSQGIRQERPDCAQQNVEAYRLGDIGSASALQSRKFVPRRRKRGYGNDWNGLGSIILFEQTSRVETAEFGQSNVHQYQVRLSITSEVDRFQTV